MTPKNEALTIEVDLPPNGQFRIEIILEFAPGVAPRMLTRQPGAGSAIAPHRPTREVRHSRQAPIEERPEVSPILEVSGAVSEMAWIQKAFQRVLIWIRVLLSPLCLVTGCYQAAARCGVRKAETHPVGDRYAWDTPLASVY